MLILDFNFEIVLYKFTKNIYLSGLITDVVKMLTNIEIEYTR